MLNGFVQLPGGKNKEKNFQDSIHFQILHSTSEKTARRPYIGEADGREKNQRSGISTGEKYTVHFSNIPQEEPLLSPFL